MKLYRTLFQYVPEVRWKAYLAIFFSLVSAAFLSVGYFLIYLVLRALIERGAYDLATRLSFWTAASLTAGGLFYFLAGTLSHLFAFRLETNLRKKGIDGITHASFAFFDHNESGAVRKTVDDNAAMTHTAVAHMLPDLGQAFLIPVLTLVTGYLVSLRLGVALTIAVVIAVILMGKMMGGEGEFMKLYQDALARLGAETVEYVRGIQVIKIFKTDVRSMKALYEAITKYSEYAYAYSKSCKLPYVTYQWVFLGIVAIVTIPLVFFRNGMGDAHSMFLELLMLVFLCGIIFVSVMRLMFAGQYLFNASYAVGNLEKLYEEMFRDRLSFGEETKLDDGSIEFRNVDFSYGGKEVFRNFNLRLEEKKVYALVGSSGSGKSTLAKLLSGFYKLSGGEILLGGKPLTAYREDAISHMISYIYQDPKLFHTTIYENVAMGKPGATKDEVMRALHLAGCDEILAKFPDREETIIGSKGVYLSQGEKQRITIARAMLKDAPILIMDEASASIDADNEYALQQSFQKLMAGKTVVMIAHRLSSIRGVDEILVMENGEVVESGSHDELYEKNGRYRHFADLYDTANDWRLAHEEAF